MNIEIISISKDDKDYQKLIDEQIKNAKKFANITIKNIKDSGIEKAQKMTGESASKEARAETAKVFTKHMVSFNIALSPEAKLIDTYEFAELLRDKNEVKFFIGGAYGLNDEFKKSCDITISLTPLTTSHKIAKLLLSEQIFRCFCIINNHKYHK